MQAVYMLTDSLPNPDIMMLVGAQDSTLLELEAGAILARERVKRGNLALDMVRLRAMHKAATGKELFPQERADAYMDLVDRCIFSSSMDSVFDSDILAGTFPGYNSCKDFPCS